MFFYFLFLSSQFLYEITYIDRILRNLLINLDVTHVIYFSMNVYVCFSVYVCVCVFARAYVYLSVCVLVCACVLL